MGAIDKNIQGAIELKASSGRLSVETSTSVGDNVESWTTVLLQEQDVNRVHNM